MAEPVPTTEHVIDVDQRPHLRGRGWATAWVWTCTCGAVSPGAWRTAGVARANGEDDHP